MACCCNIEITPEFLRALEAMEDCEGHCLVTGKAGTGKSTLLRHFRAKGSSLDFSLLMG